MSPRFSAPRPPEGKTLVAVRLEQARTYILQNPTHSKSQCCLATGCSDATIARARRDLIIEGLLPPPRNAPPKRVAAPKPKVEPSEEPAPVKTVVPVKAGSLLDHEALLKLAEMVDQVIESGDDDAIQKRLAKQALVFAFRVDLHPDTRMSASQMYYKLRDMAKAKDLGPGKPKTREAAILRMMDMMAAAGPDIVLTAVQRTFTVKEATDGQAADDQVATVGRTPQTSGETGHEGDPTPA